MKKKEKKSKRNQKKNKYLKRINKRNDKLPILNKRCSNGKTESKICSIKNESKFAAKFEIKTNIIVKMKNKIRKNGEKLKLKKTSRKKLTN